MKRLRWRLALNGLPRALLSLSLSLPLPLSFCLSLTVSRLVFMYVPCADAPPVFEKYNAVVRAMPKGSPPFFVERFEKLCKGTNLYKDTIHSINAAIVDLSRLTRAEPLYRGMSGLRLPRTFSEADQFHISGGTEFGFMSASKDFKAALNYALASDLDKPCILFEIQQAMVGRGGDLSWLSQCTWHTAGSLWCSSSPCCHLS